MLSGKEGGLRRLVRWWCVYFLVGRWHRVGFQGSDENRQRIGTSGRGFGVNGFFICFCFTGCGAEEIGPNVDAVYLQSDRDWWSIPK
jgi:hypothetical protein